MKKIIILPILLALCACEQPKLETYFITWDKDTQSQTPFYIKVYEDHAEISTDSQTQTWEKVSSIRNLNTVNECFHGILPTETAHSAKLCFKIYINENIISPESIVYDNDDGIIYSYDLALPYESGYETATKEEICIDEIEHIVYIKNSLNNDFETLQIYAEVQDPNNASLSYVQLIDLPAADAIKISANWDYSNPKFYHNNPDWVVEEHEKDACETLERLKKYATDNNIKIKAIK